MKFLDLFAGIGGFRLGMQQAGHECVGFVEWDKYARKSYEAIHETEGEWTANDIRSVTDNDLGLLRGKGIDIICGGFPCQAFSVAGKRGGFDDTRGTLFFEIARFAKQIKPRFLFLENVKGLLSHDQGNTFGTILNTLDELGYDTEWQVLNSKDFGVPQNRERVFIIGHLRGTSRREVFPIERNDSETNATKIIKVGNIRRLGKSQSEDVVSPDGLAPTMCSTTTQKDPTKIIIDDTQQGFNGIRTYEDFAPTLRSERFGLKVIEGLPIKEATKQGYDIAYPGDSINFSVPNSETRRGRVGKDVANTLDTGCQQGILTGEFKIRRLIPKECWRLQGFPDWAFDKAAAVNSDSQLYKQAGNSVTVNVIYEIAKRLGVEE
jgi:DNA (cytosine-5)-methyltransferase 1